MILLCRLAAVIGLASLISACGGGSDDYHYPSTVPLIPGVPYRLAFSAISTARLDVPIDGIQISVRLPAGVAISTPGGGSGQIDGVTQGSTLTGKSLIMGNYSASTRRAYLNMGSSTGVFRGGEYLNLAFTVLQGASVSESDLVSLNGVFSDYKVAGTDTTAHSTVDMTARVRTMLQVLPLAP